MSVWDLSIREKIKQYEATNSERNEVKSVKGMKKVTDNINQTDRYTDYARSRGGEDRKKEIVRKLERNMEQKEIINTNSTKENRKMGKLGISRFFEKVTDKVIFRVGFSLLHGYLHSCF